MDNILSLIHESVSRYPDKPALRTKRFGHWKEMSYAELWQFSDRIAAGLLNRGAGQGRAHIAILAPSSPVWVASYLAILKACGTVVPVDKELKSSELKHVLSHSESSALFTTEDYLETVLELREALPKLKHIIILPSGGECTAPDRNQREIQRLLNDWEQLLNELKLPEEQSQKLENLVERLHTLSSKRTTPKKTKSGHPLFSPLTKLKRRVREPEELLMLDELVADETAEFCLTEPSECAAILYTSGTTGRPKGAMLSHANIVSNIRAAVDAYDLDSDMHTLSFLPINHVFEQVVGILLPLSVGGTVSFAESIKKIADNLGEVRPSFLLAVPALYRRIYDRIRKGLDQKALANLLFRVPLTRELVTRKIQQSLGAGTIFISGGAALDPAVSDGLKKFGIQIYQGYGITETSPVISAERPGESASGTVGKPLEGIEVKILDPNSEGVGEIAARGPNVMMGYYKDTAATEEVLIEGWYHTGDLGRIDEKGYLQICGRVKNLIVTANGKNVYPEEVEEALLGSDLIAEVMVYGHKEGTSEEVYAIIYPNHEEIDRLTPKERSEGFSRSEIEALIRDEVNRICRTLADYKRVRKFTLREDEFPKTTTRKIKRYVVEPNVKA